MSGASIWPGVNVAWPWRSPYTAAPARSPTTKARATLTSFVNRIDPMTAPTSARISAVTMPNPVPNRNPTALPSSAPMRDMTLDQIPWPQNASARPMTTRTTPMMTAASPETTGSPGTAMPNHSARPIKRHRGRSLSRRLTVAEDVVRALGDFPDPAFVDGLGTDDVFPHVLVVVVEDVDDRRDADRVADHRDRPQRQLRDDVLPHLLVWDAGKGRLDVGRFLQRHDEPVRELAADFVRDAGRPLVHEGQDQIELPRLPREAAERVRVRRDRRAQELVGLLEEEDEPREFLVPLGVQLEEAAGKDVRDEEVHHLPRPVAPARGADAPPFPAR